MAARCLGYRRIARVVHSRNSQPDPQNETPRTESVDQAAQCLPRTRPDLKINPMQTALPHSGVRGRVATTKTAETPLGTTFKPSDE